MNHRKMFVAAGLGLAIVATVAAMFWLAAGGDRTATVEVSPQAAWGSVAETREAPREPIPLGHDAPIAMTIYMSPQCGCCGVWVDHVKEHGFDPEVRHQTDMGEVKRTFRIPWQLSSCHTALVNGYVVEGHVPGEDIRRLLAEAPEAHGLTVPGMPIGSPGMEAPDGRIEAYEVLLMRSDGSTRVFARHGPRAPTR
jgi:hypothetical protein